MTINRYILLLTCSLLLFGTTQAFGSAPQRLTAHPALDYQPAISANGQTMAFVSTRSGNPDIWLQSLGRSGLTLPRQMTTHTASDLNPSLNRDGTRLLYVSHKSDPRGDVYLLDLITQEEERLTDLTSGDTFPQWDPQGNGFFYLKTDPGQQTASIYRQSLPEKTEELIVPQATSFSVNREGQIMYTDGSGLKILNLEDNQTTTLSQSTTALDLWPTIAPHTNPLTTTQLLFFARYERDTNDDGLVDTDDESSIWMQQWDVQQEQSTSLYRLTPIHQFHAYPTVSGDFVYYADLKAGDIFRIEIPSFLKEYATLAQAQSLASSYQDTQQPNLALLVLTNISQNLLGEVTPDERAVFDFSVAETLAQEGNFLAARQIIERHTQNPGRIGALAHIHKIVLLVQEQARGNSSAERHRLAQHAVTDLERLGKEHHESSDIYGETLIGAGRLYLFADDPLKALDYFLKVDAIPDETIRAKALFARGEAYQILGDAQNVIHVFIEVIQSFGEQSSWGTRAIQHIIRLVREDTQAKEQISSLNRLITQYPELPILAGTSRLHIAELYHDQGEQLSALETLDLILVAPALPRSLTIQAYQHKAKILSESERYQEAADTYAALNELSGGDKTGFNNTQSLLISQLIRKAIKGRKTGEVRIAAKSLRRLIATYPTSVQAHRAYIATKAMLKDIPEVQSFYHELVNAHPDHAVYQYSHALAVSYSEPPDLPFVISLLHHAKDHDPSIGAIHQTLGWAYEQYERVSGENGYLENAEEEYRIALEMNDAARFPEVESQLLLNLGNTYLALSNFREAYRHYRQRDVQYSPTGEGTTEWLYRKNYGEACFKSGRSLESITQYHLALRKLPEKQLALKSQLLERLGLSHQDIGQYAEAITTFTQAMELNRELDQPQNVTLLQRNIGVNLFNLSQSSQAGGREKLQEALSSYFTSLDRLTSDGKKALSTGPGLINIKVALSEGGSQAATGFDQIGEKKLLFSYIASTYEHLKEPGPAYEFYEKKLALLHAAAPDSQDAASLTEKAIVLNRMGVLSYQLDQSDQAIEAFRQSLHDTRALNMPFGTSINLFNLSKLMVENRLAGHLPDHTILDNIIGGIHELQFEGYEDRHLFFTLTNTAFLLSWLPEPTLTNNLAPAETVQRIHDQFRYQTLPWSYYQQAEELLHNPDVFSQDEQPATHLLVKLNQAELSRREGFPAISSTIQNDIKVLVEEHHTANGWLWYLSEAEQAANPLVRHTFLNQAVEELLRFPPQTEPRTGFPDLGPAYDRLSQLTVEQFVQNEQPEQAFIVSEQLHVHQLTSALYQDLGEDFFLKGLGTYEPELKELFARLRKARSENNVTAIQELTPILQDTLYALFEEYPWATASFWAYPTTSDLLSLVLNAQHPYLKILKGTRQYHGFIHTGDSLHYSALRWENGTITGNEEFHQQLAHASSAYVSLPQELKGALSSLALDGKPLTWVSHSYDFLNGYHQRSLFFSTISSAPGFTPSLPSHVGEIPFSLTAFTGIHAKDSHLASQSDVAIFLETPTMLKFEVQKTRNVREFASIRDFAGTQHHSILLLGNPPSSSFSTKVLVEALLRAGFPHVIMSQSPLDEHLANRFVTQYLTRLANLPPDEAVMGASQDIWGTEAHTHPILHYGFAGMNTDEREEYAVSMYEQEVGEAIDAFEQQDFSTSLGHIEHALALIDHARQQQDFVELTTLAVETAFEINDYHKGIFYQHKLLETFTADTPASERAEATYRLGILYSRLDSFDEAVTHLEQANRLWQEGEELDRLAEGIATLGVVRENMGGYTEALEKFRESFSLYHEIGELSATAFQYRRIGRIYYLRLGRYEKARENFHAAREIYRNQDDPQGEAEVLYEIGLTFEKVGLFDQATDHYQQAQRLAHDLDDLLLLTTGDLYLANIAWFQGEYQTAFQLLSQAKKRAEHLDDPQLQIMVSNTRGLVYWTLNETDKGLHHLQEAVTLSEASDIQTELASSLNNLGLLYRQRGEQTAALENFHRAKAIDESLNSQWGLGYDHRNIGMSLLALQRLEEAEDHFLKAERISKDIHNVINWVKALLELGNVNRALNRPERALPYYEQAHTVAKRHGIREVEWRAATGKARILQQQGNLPDAFTWFNQSIDVVESMRASLKIDELRNSFQTNKLDVYRDIITLLITMNRTNEAFNYLERSRSRSFIDLLGNQKIPLKNQEDQDTWAHINDLASTLDSLRSELGSYDNPPANLQERYRHTQIAYEEAILDVKQQNPALSSFVVVDPLNLEGVQDLLSPKVGLLSYFLTKDQLYLWLITQERTIFKSVSVKEDELTRLVTRYRQLVQHIEPVDEELQELYGYLIQPIQPALTNLDFLGIIPDGPLHFLSFAALKHGPAYLVDDIPLFYAPSASVFQFTFAKRHTKKNNRVLAIGNPDLGNFNYDLPLAELEARSIKWNYPQIDILTGAKATKEWVVNNISKYGIIHLASHGEFDELNPLLSALWFASPDPENRQLTVKEIFGLELNADLVTLSACQTGLGKLEAGELIGLNRAFIYAGTHALISSLWRVDDLSTSVLMKHFYRHYVTSNKARSLRQAQLIVKKDFPHPSYWAGFSLIGDYQ